MCVDWLVVFWHSFSRVLTGSCEGYVWVCTQVKSVCVVGRCVHIATSPFSHFCRYMAVLWAMLLYVTNLGISRGCSHSFDNQVVQYIITLAFTKMVLKYLINNVQ